MNDYPNTAPAKRPGLRMTPGLLSGAMAVLVLMVFTIVFLATRQPPPAPVITQVSARTSRPTEEATEPGTPPCGLAQRAAFDQRAGADGGGEVHQGGRSVQARR